MVKPFTPGQLYVFALKHFSPVVAIAIGAIALRESAGIPTAFNGNKATGDASYGLMQINMIGALGVARLKQFNITHPDQLFDPDTNMRAAGIIMNGNVHNLGAAWYIDRDVSAAPGLPTYKAAYESHLPAMMAAALGLTA